MKMQKGLWNTNGRETEGEFLFPVVSLNATFKIKSLSYEVYTNFFWIRIRARAKSPSSPPLKLGCINATLHILYKVMAVIC